VIRRISGRWERQQLSYNRSGNGFWKE